MNRTNTRERVKIKEKAPSPFPLPAHPRGKSIEVGPPRQVHPIVESQRKTIRTAPIAPHRTRTTRIAPTRQVLQSRPRHSTKHVARRFKKVQRGLERHRTDQRFQHELKEMRETKDLERIDDDVEAVATLFEWHAPEHTHRPQSPMWYAMLAVCITLISIGFIIFSNIIAGVTIALMGALVYYITQQEPKDIRYRIMAEGVAFNNILYHYRDLDAFNIVYEPGEVKVVLLRSKKPFAPLLHMEIGDTDPVAIRDILIEFVKEDQELDEPVIDIIARRLGF